MASARKLIALFEALKGVAALAASIGILSLLHHDLRQIILNLIGHFSLNPDARYPSLVIQYATLLEDMKIRTLVLLAVGYTSIRLLEAYGLWHALAWADWLGALSGAIYVPFELRHFVHRPSVISASVVLINIAVVCFLAYQLWLRRRREQSLQRKVDP